jgi:hypothetical protein
VKRLHDVSAQLGVVVLPDKVESPKGLSHPWFEKR